MGNDEHQGKLLDTRTKITNEESNQQMTWI